MSSPLDPVQNRLLAELELAEFHRLFPHLELVKLVRKDVLYQAGGKMFYVYFPTSATISIDYVLENGGTSEIASIGNEGMLGISLFMGGLNAHSRAVVQLDGYAFRLSAQRLMDEFYHKGPLLRLLLRYAQARLTMVSQLAVCNSHHTTEQRLCRWLLQTLDRSLSSELPITQEAIGAILGVRREGITEATGRLQMAGVVKWRRGHVNVLSREGLNERVCECYEVVCSATTRLATKLGPEFALGKPPWRERNLLVSRRAVGTDRRKHDSAADDAVEESQLEELHRE
ncbi:Crp/Fnr family transcriptional regulator [Duganella sp. BuS-21]|uniref:Crp/Fnr family transcriptional regulator n=1 Tax=Duganella sp. BuS-21 TaxID=2943848 RepID=UPI0035A5BA7A